MKSQEVSKNTFVFTNVSDLLHRCRNTHLISFISRNKILVNAHKMAVLGETILAQNKENHKKSAHLDTDRGRDTTQELEIRTLKAIHFVNLQINCNTKRLKTAEG